LNENIEQPGEQPESGFGAMAPSEPGSYVLIMRLEKPTKITIGRLGTFEFEAGYYAYAGSALGPGGLAARLSYHNQREKTMQWHIDYLLNRAQMVEIWWAVDRKRKECIWASALRSVPGARVLVPSFGASDCRCLTHLFHFDQAPAFASFARSLSDLEF
jgi:Uri superfamily endonuclease